MAAIIYSEGINGLTSSEVEASEKLHGRNLVNTKKENNLWAVLKSILVEPMFILLIVTCAIYFITTEYSQGFLMLGAVMLVSGISLFQEYRSKNAVDALKKLSQPHAKVLRNSEPLVVMSEEIVVKDIIIVEEGNIIPADAIIVHSNDFSVNESILTGESFPVNKDQAEGNNQLRQGTLVTSGSALAEVNAIGQQTELGKLGKSLEDIKEEKTPLHKQITSFVKVMAIIGLFAFLLVWGINYYETRNVLTGLLHGLTLAMSILPEEIPVAFATFMALGAVRMMRQHILVKQPQTVESLGSATVICIDKTGTITENKMSLAKVYDFAEDKIIDIQKCEGLTCKEIVAYAMWASERNAFDPMEIAIHEAYSAVAMTDERPDFEMIHEYPISGTPPMMTHVYAGKSGEKIIASKGAAEAIIHCCKLDQPTKQKVISYLKQLASAGYRVLGVAKSNLEGTEYPEFQQDFEWHFLGLIALYDPPKKNFAGVLQKFYSAGIQVNIITGDYAETAQAIAREVGFRNADNFLTGEEVIKLDFEELRKKVKGINLFARMFPDAKLKIIEALKANGEVVAMTGDGVNDGPALKAAHIGVAMGSRGTEIAKGAASLILIDDDLSRMVTAVALGRRIYTNLKKAIRYIISVHIPIILTVIIPLLFGWKYGNIFSPIHIVFFEIIMGPTCSIIFENEPMEANLMNDKPRKTSHSLLSFSELFISIIQGLVITFVILLLFYQVMASGKDEATTRTMVYVTLIFANIFLTLVNRSFYFSIVKTIAYKNILVPIIIILTVILLALQLWVPALSRFFEIIPLSFLQISICLLAGFISVIWIEPYKWIKRYLVANKKHNLPVFTQ